MSMDTIWFYKGQRFVSYDEFDETVQQYQQYTYHDLTIADSKANTEEGFPYLFKVIKCKKSGTFKSKGAGIRIVKSEKTNCPFSIRLRISKSKKHLEISRLNLIHNHLAIDVSPDDDALMGNIPDDNKFHFMNINEVVIAETKENMIEDTNEKELVVEVNEMIANEDPAVEALDNPKKVKKEAKNRQNRQISLEQQYKAIQCELKPDVPPVESIEFETVKLKYKDLLTPQAYSKLLLEIDQCKFVKFQYIDSELLKCTINENDRVLNVSPVSCDCFEPMLLPCRHVLAARHLFNLSLFDESLCHEQCKKVEIFAEQIEEQRKQMQVVADRLMETLGEETDDEKFYSRLNVLKWIVEVWKSGDEVAVEENDIGEYVLNVVQGDEWNDDQESQEAAVPLKLEE